MKKVLEIKMVVRESAGGGNLLSVEMFHRGRLDFVTLGTACGKMMNETAKKAAELSGRTVKEELKRLPVIATLGDETPDGVG